MIHIQYLNYIGLRYKQVAAVLWTICLFQVFFKGCGGILSLKTLDAFELRAIDWFYCSHFTPLYTFNMFTVYWEGFMGISILIK